MEHQFAMQLQYAYMKLNNWLLVTAKNARQQIAEMGVAFPHQNLSLILII